MVHCMDFIDYSEVLAILSDYLCLLYFLMHELHNNNLLLRWAKEITIALISMGASRGKRQSGKRVDI